tara:strand:+ start:185 stop:439 length:255 start_codon:yes stop_codon:yes gene_type:complete
MQVLVYRPESDVAESKDIKTFTDIRNLVGGFVCVATQDNEKALLCNEDGLLLNLPPNPHFPGLVGTCVVASLQYNKLPYGEDLV